MTPTEQYTFATIIILQIITIALLSRRRTLATSKITASRTNDAVVLDTCALIDGRIRDLVDAGFITGSLYVPRRVIEELQYLADHGDAHKRSRARFGLDVVQTLQETPNKVTVLEAGHDTDTEVDEHLINLALENDASLYTTDYNLNKVARIRGVPVLNVNELAHALRPIHLPGETLTVKIVQKGESHSQGVGYLEDGTMAVVEGAAQRQGQHVTAEVERMLQTEAGKMVFARLEQVNSKSSRKTSSNNRRQRNNKR